MKEVVLVEAEVVTEFVQVGHANFLPKAFFVFLAIVPQVFQEKVNLGREGSVGRTVRVGIFAWLAAAWAALAARGTSAS